MKDKDILLQQLDWDWLCASVVRATKHSYNIQAHCPYHDDHHSSLNITKSNGLYYCHACGASGDFIKLICDQLQIDFKEAVALISGSGYKSRRSNNVLAKQKQSVKPPQLSWSMIQVNAKHAELLQNEDYLKAIDNYGISLDIVKRFRLGIQEDYDCLRLIIPIGDLSNLISVKMHRITGNPKNKSISAPGSRAYIYPFKNVMAANKLLLLEGEPDALCAFSNNVESLGVTPFTFTGGAMTFKMEWVPFLLNKTVYIAYDPDRAGATGTDKILSYMEGRANIFLVSLGSHDMRDYFNKDHRTTNELSDILKMARPYDKYHPVYIKRRLYPILEESCGDRFKWNGLKQEIDKFFGL